MYIFKKICAKTGTSTEDVKQKKTAVTNVYHL